MAESRETRTRAEIDAFYQPILAEWDAKVRMNYGSMAGYFAESTLRMFERMRERDLDEAIDRLPRWDGE